MKKPRSFFRPLTLLVPLGLLSAGCMPGGVQEAAPEPAVTLEALDEMRFPPLAPEEAGGSFAVQDGFRMELIAAEPLVYDPVTMVYDENGRAYVAEMSDYPYVDRETHQAWADLDNQAPIGRVRLLEDTDGDGTFDRSTIFAEGLSWPTGLGVWKGGVFVTATPDLWYLKDTDGDRRADVREKVYTGFRKFNVQGVINNLEFGLDHRFYGAGASNGGQIRPGDRPEAEPVAMGRNDFRFDPVSRAFEVIAGGARFGNTFDSWGNRFICHIRNPVQHVVLPSHYLARNPYLPVASAIHDAAEAGDNIPVFRISPPEPWRALRAARWSADPTNKSPRSELRAAGYWTSSSGITVYRGAAYPEAYRGNLFIGEVANNVIHRQVPTPDGVTFRSVRADEGVEFVASRDTWFRGVNLVNAPDGTLHVLDMYREVIEHPWSIPDDIHAKLDLLSGQDRGRIYRLAPPGFRPPPPPRLGEATTAALVAALENPNGWWRDTAHRLLFERQDPAAVAPLRRLLAESRMPLARMHALWSLEGLGALREEDLARGLADPVPGVREHAVRLAEARLARAPGLVDRVLALAGDPDPRVRFQVAFTLGAVADDRVTDALVRIARQDAGDAWVRTAVLSSAAEESGPMLVRLLQDGGVAGEEGGRDLLRQLALVVGARARPAEVRQVLDRLAAAGGAEGLLNEVVIGLGDGLRRAGKTLRGAVPEAGTPAARFVDALLARAQEAARDPGLSTEARRQAVRLLAYEDFGRPGVRETLRALLDPRQAQEVQLAAVHTLAGFADPQVADVLLEPWPRYTPTVQGEVIEAMVGRSDRVGPLLDAVAAGRVPAGQIGATTRDRLLKHRDEAIRRRAAALFGDEARGSRDEVVARYRAALSLPGDARRGEQVYGQVCMACHRAGEQGTDVGPNLASVRHKTAEELLVHILDPNREVSPEYVLYQVELRDGQRVTGMIAAETPSGITLQRPGDIQQTILRQHIVQIASTGASLMPEGLEASLSEQAMADLLQFLREPQP